MNNAYGDFQTPPDLAWQTVKHVLAGKEYDTIVEPTCGVGSFLHAAFQAWPNANLLGVEINPDHAQAAKSLVPKANVVHADAFAYEWGGVGGEKILVLGNPPWVTNSEQGVRLSNNLPVKSNLPAFKGLDALTGASNFDVSEYLIMKIVSALHNKNVDFCLLCKAKVARNLTEHFKKLGLNLYDVRYYRINAKKYFNAAVEAVCFYFSLTPNEDSIRFFPSLEAKMPAKSYAYENRRLVETGGVYSRLRHLDGACPYVWRQGVKHDLSKIVELEKRDGSYFNRLNQRVDVESECIYPLIKSSDVYHGRPVNRYVVMPYERVNGEWIFRLSPLTERYFTENTAYFQARKSKIYSKSRFSYFGVGPYSFKPYKIVISGFHKTPRFRLLEPFENKPVIVDDVCYFLSFEDRAEAHFVFEQLSRSETTDFLLSIAFPDNKRPFSKKVLERLAIRPYKTTISELAF
jgi:hypothetical protein